MPTEDLARAKILKCARALIGTKYDKLDCSHMVHKAYEGAELTFPYTQTSSYGTLIGTYFTSIEKDKLQPGDLVLFPGHVGIYDPDGCSVQNTAECQKLDGEDMRILSARSGKNLGTEYGRSTWFGTVKNYLRWAAFDKATATN